MVARVLRPEGKGFVFLDSHPAGQIWQLYGFDVPGIDYSQPVDVDVPWPATPATPECPSC